MASSFLTLHIYADGCVQNDIERAGRFLATVGAQYYNLTTCARYNEAESIIRTIKRMAPNARPLWRGYPNTALEDGGIWQRTKPQEFINYRIIPNASWLRELGVYVVTCNEVGVLGKDAEDYAQWEADVTRIAFLQSSVHTAILRLSTGNPLESEHGRYNAALEAAATYGSILSPNEYTAREGEIVTNWHVGRYRWMWAQQDLNGWRKSPVVIGEYGVTKLTLANTPDPSKGYQADNVNIDEHVGIIKRDGQIYQNDGTSAAWFTFGHWQDGGGTFDVQNNEPLLSAVEHEAQLGNLAFKVMPVKPVQTAEIPVVAIEATPDLPVSLRNITPGGIYRLTTSGAEITVRTSQSDTDRVIASIPNNSVVTAYNRVTVNGSNWLQITYPSFGNKGWVKMDGIGIRQTLTMSIVKDDTPTPPEIPVTPAAEFIPPKDTGPKAQLDARYIDILCQRLDAARLEVQLLEALVALAEGKVA